MEKKIRLDVDPITTGTEIWSLHDEENDGLNDASNVNTDNNDEDELEADIEVEESETTKILEVFICTVQNIKQFAAQPLPKLVDTVTPDNHVLKSYHRGQTNFGIVLPGDIGLF